MQNSMNPRPAWLLYMDEDSYNMVPGKVKLEKNIAIAGLTVLLALSSGCASTKGWTNSTVFKRGAYRKVGGDTFQCVLYRYEPNESWFFIFEATDTWSTEKVTFTLKSANGSCTLGDFAHEVRAASGIWLHKLVEWNASCRMESRRLKGRIEGKIHCDRWPEKHTHPFLLEFSLPENPAEYERLRDLQEHDIG
jgi:hypothetical protein